ncbi:MAG: succinate dehydrogenase assembly factor 2 [Proteobacteria bacterium]|nr:succinate dehydrogenase assembly factor 2 [Pseudomonadota bacterium]
MGTERSQLIWRCRRGIREMDIVLQDFLNNAYDTLNESDKTSFIQLLDEADLDILNWLMGKDEPETDELKHIIKVIRESRV